MGAEAVLAAFAGLAGILGGFLEGRRRARDAGMEVAVNTVELLQAQVEALAGDRRDKDSTIADLQSRVKVLESLITQRAEVEAVHKDVKTIKNAVHRIAAKVGA